MTTNAFAPSTDPNDRIMAALAQVTVLLPLIGVIAPIVIWVTQRDRSRYVSFQALQAVVYQLLMVLFWVLGMGCYMFSFFGTFLLTIPLASASNGSADPEVGLLAMIPIFFPFAVLGLMMFGFLIFIVYGCIAAVLVFKGKDFRYFLIGNWLARYLQKDQPIPA
jgi:uncharacterized Tic20 family protein